MQVLEWYLADLKPTGKNTVETVSPTCLLDWFNTFIELLSSEHSKTINNLAIFVYFGLKVFAKL